MKDRVSMKDLLKLINSKMHGGTCPTARSLGECANISQDDGGLWQAVLYIWDASFHDSTQVAKWLHDAGATEVFVTHVLYDSINDDHDGQCIDGGRAWWVYFRMTNDCDALAEPAHVCTAQVISTQTDIEKIIQGFERTHCTLDLERRRDGTYARDKTADIFNTFRSGFYEAQRIKPSIDIETELDLINDQLTVGECSHEKLINMLENFIEKLRSNLSASEQAKPVAWRVGKYLTENKKAAEFEAKEFSLPLEPLCVIPSASNDGGQS